MRAPIEIMRCDGVPSVIRPAITSAMCRPCIWRFTPATDEAPRFARPPMTEAFDPVHTVACDQRQLHEHKVGDSAACATPQSTGGRIPHESEE